MAKKVKVYSAVWCPWCSKVKDFLRENNIEFEELDVEGDRKNLDELVEKSGQTGIPVVDVDGQIIVGFNQEALRKALEI